MSRRKKIVAVMAAVLALVAVATGAGFAAAGDDEPLTGTALEQATAAALAETGGGEVVGTEIGDDDGSAYEVEVVLPDGSQVEVQLAADFAVIATETDDDGAGDDDEGDEEG